MPDQTSPPPPSMPFAGIPSFLRAPVCADLARLDADIAVVGVPTDEGSPFMPGSRFAPRSIREHSLRFAGDVPGVYDPQERRRFLEPEMAQSRIADVGDADILPTNVVGSFQNITRTVAGVLQRGAMPVILGGDHAITFPVVRGFGGTGPLYVVHFDAHLDYMPFVHGLEYTNAHAFRHIRQMDYVQGITQAGIRSLRSTEVMLEDSLRDGNRVVTMRDFRRDGPAGVLAGLPSGARCYVSIDIDVLDMPLVPGCVSAEPEGMTYAELRDTLIALAGHTDVIGFDLVEVNPMLDVGTGVTSYLAAHTVVEFLAFICDQPGWKARRARARLAGLAGATRHTGGMPDSSEPDPGAPRDSAGHNERPAGRSDGYEPVLEGIRALHHRMAELERLASAGDRAVAPAFRRAIVPAWRRATQGEPRWHVAGAAAAAIALQLPLPGRLVLVRPTWLLPVLEAAMVLLLAALNPRRIDRESAALRWLALAVTGLISLANAWSAARLVTELVQGTQGNTAGPLLSSGAVIWLTNVIVFGMWYWEFDRGGPVARAHATHAFPDFLFPQMTSPDLAPADWEPAFGDYLYTAFTNATAFSPTDVMPLSRWAKGAMALQAGVSIVTVALVISRAVNVLK